MPSKDSPSIHKQFFYFISIVKKTFISLYARIMLWIFLGLPSFMIALLILPIPWIVVSFIGVVRDESLSETRYFDTRLCLSKIFSIQWKNLFLCTLSLFFMAILIAVLCFYWTTPFQHHWIKMIGISVSFWSLLFFSFLVPFLWFIWILFEDIPIKKSFVLAFSCVMAYPLVIVLTLLFYLLITIILSLSIIGLVCLWIPFTVLLYDKLFHCIIEISSDNNTLSQQS